MKWHELYPQGNPPETAQISAYIANPLWEELISFLEKTYRSQPLAQYSKCSMDPGWNIKYRKGSVAICSSTHAQAILPAWSSHVTATQSRTRVSCVSHPFYGHNIRRRAPGTVHAG